MKLTIVHNTYTRNRFIKESVALNLKALEECGVDYQYVIYNDNGDSLIKEDVADLISDKVEYVYSNINYGMKVCCGGWEGGLPYIKGELVHNTGQDDVFTAYFYKSLIERLNNDNIYLAYANGLSVHEDLTMQGSLLGPLHEIDYSQPRKVFDHWFQRRGSTLTAANNYIPAPGVIYKTELHTKIGSPDLRTFKGSADFEYWARVLFNNLAISYDPMPSWLYRVSEYSLGSKPAAASETPNWNNLILKKYQEWLTQSLQEEQGL